MAKSCQKKEKKTLRKNQKKKNEKRHNSGKKNTFECIADVFLSNESEIAVVLPFQSDLLFLFLSYICFC